MKYFISRHPGAQQWAEERVGNVEMVTHFDPTVVCEGDTVIGTLPVHLAAVVCARGGKYQHLVLNIPVSARGSELTAEDMVSFGAELTEFVITQST